jgi:hypothetical protein
LFRSADYQPASLLLPLAGGKPALRKLSMTLDGKESARRKPQNVRILARGSNTQTTPDRVMVRSAATWQSMRLHGLLRGARNDDGFDLRVL